MANMKESFENWISSIKQNNGKPYSRETISGYISSLRTHAARLSDVSLKTADLFEIDSIDDFRPIYKAIKTSADFDRINKEYHRIFSSALRIYERFLMQADNKTNTSKSPFREWLRVYPDHKYTEATITRYIRALDKSEEWLGINLARKIIEIDSLSEFNTVERQIRETPDYAEVNQSHGHGDLSAALRLYRKYLESGHATDLEKDDGWWPALNEYTPGISKDQWIIILNDPQYIGPIWGGVLAKFYAYGGAATCSQIAERYGGSPMSVSGTCTQLAKAIQKATDCALYDAGDDRNRYWPILFQGRKASSDEKGSWVWKLRPELKEALDEVDILRFLQEEGEPEMIMTTKEAIDQIKSYIAAKGFTYDDGLIENFYLSLKSKPFVILAGTSGTGKTRLVKLFAEAIGADYKMVSVRPDWSDGSDLFGHTDLNGNFIDGPICAAFDSAIEEPARPVLLCLDEMNLARVEYYLSDFLSVIESRDRDDSGKVVTDQIAQYDGGIPDNLYIVGTVNMDETTFPFSKKVLDRANTIEFNYVDLIPGFDAFDTDIEPLHLPNAFLSTEYLVLTEDCEKEKDFVIEICDELQKVNAILRKANAHVGYRVRDEIVFYMLNNKKAENLLTYEQALDNEIMQKILPRIQGSQVAIRDLLIELFKYCMGNYSGLDTESGNAGKQMQTMADSAKYPESAKKIGYMMTRYEEDGFTSYWL